VTAPRRHRRLPYAAPQDPLVRPQGACASSSLAEAGLPARGGAEQAPDDVQPDVPGKGPAPPYGLEAAALARAAEPVRHEVATLRSGEPARLKRCAGAALGERRIQEAPGTHGVPCTGIGRRTRRSQPDTGDTQGAPGA
jgi:hypothetical protein